MQIHALDEDNMEGCAVNSTPRGSVISDGISDEQRRRVWQNFHKHHVCFFFSSSSSLVLSRGRGEPDVIAWLLAVPSPPPSLLLAPPSPPWTSYDGRRSDTRELFLTLLTYCTSYWCRCEGAKLPRDINFAIGTERTETRALQHRLLQPLGEPSTM